MTDTTLVAAVATAAFTLLLIGAANPVVKRLNPAADPEALTVPSVLYGLAVWAVTIGAMLGYFRAITLLGSVGQWLLGGVTVAATTVWFATRR